MFAKSLLPILFLLFIPLAGSGQGLVAGPDEGRILATSAYGEVRAGEFYRAIACEYGREPKRQAALQQLIQVQIILRELALAKLTITPEEVESHLNRIRKQATQNGKSLDEMLQKQGFSLALFRFYTRIDLARKRLTAKALNLPAKDVTRSQERVWVDHIRKNHKTDVCLDQLEKGIAARVDGQAIRTELFGWVIAAGLKNTKKDFDKLTINAIISSRRINQLAAQAKLTVTRQDEEMEIARRRANVKSDPRWHGASLDELLQQFKGFTVELLRRSTNFQSHIMLDKLVLQKYPEEKQLAHLEANRKQYLVHFGESRHLWHMAIQRGNSSPDAVHKRALAIKAKIKGLPTFRLCAGHNANQAKKGAESCDLGFVHRIQKGIPQPILDLAFTLKPNEVGGPIQTEKAFHLIMVSQVRPVPTDKKLLAHVRKDLRDKFHTKLLKEAEIKILLAP